jgi:hypothetical protein
MSFKHLAGVAVGAAVLLTGAMAQAQGTPPPGWSVPNGLRKGFNLNSGMPKGVTGLTGGLNRAGNLRPGWGTGSLPPGRRR